MVVINKFKYQIRNLSALNRVIIVATASIFIALTVSATSMQPKIKNIIKTEPVITTKTEFINESIPFTKQTNYSEKLSIGQSKIETPGVNGTKAITYTITLTDGVETKRTSTELIVAEPIDEVTTIGTCDGARSPGYCSLVKNGEVNGTLTQEETVNAIVKKLAPYATTYTTTTNLNRASSQD